MALGFGLLRMDENDLVAKGLFKDFDQLGGEGDCGDEEDGGLIGSEGFFGESEVDVGFTRAGDAVEEFGGGGYVC